MRRVRLGVIGCGVIGRIHLSMAVQMEHIQLMAVADTNYEAASAAGEIYGVQAVYYNGHDLIDEE
ncbi:Gfo/Idh/MocA family oxidoreductase [Paenibacillus psychroresistens]|nr:hypothetical protein [Paenibacillus psychroresistens]